MERGRGRHERGQGSLEYGGLVLLAAILVGGIVYATGWGHPIRESVESSICEIVSGGSGNCGFPETGLSPEEQATAGDYVALGDSYSSGEGADDYLEGTNDDEATKEAINDFNGWLWPGDPHNNICRRSANAYSAGVYGSFDFEGDYIFGACSGGVVTDYYQDNTSDNEGEGPQRDHITDDTSLITMGMGGNDFGFGSVMKSCVLGGSCATEEHAEEVDADIDAEIDTLAQLYRDMEADAPPGARILIVGYPQMFPDQRTSPTAATPSSARTSRAGSTTAASTRTGRSRRRSGVRAPTSSTSMSLTPCPVTRSAPTTRGSTTSTSASTVASG